MVAWLAGRCRREADLLVVGADTRSEAHEVVRRMPGPGGWVDLLVKPAGVELDGDRPCHMALG